MDTNKKFEVAPDWEELFKFIGPNLKQDQIKHEACMMSLLILSDIDVEIGKQNINRRELASRTNIHYREIMKMYRGDRIVDFKSLIPFCKALDLEIEFKLKSSKHEKETES